MTDQEKDLLERMNAAFSAAMQKDAKISRFMRKADQGDADYDDAWEYSDRIGQIASDVAKDFAQEIVDIDDGYEAVYQYLVQNCYDQAADYTAKAQDILYQEAGLGIKAQKPEADRSKASGLANKASNAENAEAARKVLDEPLKNFTSSAVGDTLKKNLSFLSDSGIRAKVKRKSTFKCCEWCSSLAGSYTYPDVPREVFQRHENCRCTVVYDGKELKAYKGASGKANTFREEQEYSRRKIGSEGYEIIDKATYNKVTRDFIRNGGLIIRGEVAKRHLSKLGATASYIAGGNIAFIRDEATVSDVLEEMYHAKQDRQKKYEGDRLKILKREIDAQKYLIENADKYKIPEKERIVTEENLKRYLRLLGGLDD